MNIEDQLLSLELSKKLKELGIKQDGLFSWNKCHGTYHLQILSIDSSLVTEKYSAFTVAELMDMLPAMIDTKENEPFNNYWFAIDKRTAKHIKYIVTYYCDTTERIMAKLSKLFSCHDEKLADCLAKTLIYCIEKGYIKNE